jgi:hypothetical protein
VERWPTFLEGAGAAGVRAVFAFPLRIGAITLGALDLYRDRPGESRAGGSRAAPSERDPAVGIDFLRGGARPPLPLIVDYIEEHRDAFGVEPICSG